MKPPYLCSEYVFVLKPNYELMRQAYDSYITNKEYGICPRLFKKRGKKSNHCAVRMSIALARAGSITLDYFGSKQDHPSNHDRGNRVHYRGMPAKNCCGLELPHVPGATELARHIQAIWGPWEVYRDTSLAATKMKNRKGIVYFENCFTQAGRKGKGDHIDLWDGENFWNIYLKKSAGGGEDFDAPLFKRSSQVWFMPL